MLHRSLHAAAPLAFLTFLGCSTVPKCGYPPFQDAVIAARCRVPADGRLQVPHSDADLIVRRLSAEPAPRAERFDDDGRRWLLYDADTWVVIRTSLRAYGPPPAREALLPQAVEWLDAP